MTRKALLGYPLLLGMGFLGGFGVSSYMDCVSDIRIEKDPGDLDPKLKVFDNSGLSVVVRNAGQDDKRAVWCFIDDFSQRAPCVYPGDLLVESSPQNTGGYYHILRKAFRTTKNGKRPDIMYAISREGLSNDSNVLQTFEKILEETESPSNGNTAKASGGGTSESSQSQ